MVLRNYLKTHVWRHTPRLDAPDVGIRKLSKTLSHQDGELKVLKLDFSLLKSVITCFGGDSYLRPYHSTPS